MKVYKEDSEIHKKVEQVADLMDKLGLSMCYESGQIRFTDEKVKDAVLIGIDCEEELQEFPPYCDFKLKKLDSD